MKGKRRLIYGLIDPRNQELRYIGKSVSGLRRPKSHLRSVTQKSSHLYSWIKQLVALNLTYDICILQDGLVSDQDLVEAEIYWIAVMRMIGARLTNMTSGGEGWLGRRHSPKTIELMTKHQPAQLDIAVKHYQQGLSLRSSAALIGADNKTLRDYMDRIGIARRPNVTKKLTANDIEVAQERVKSGESWIKVSKSLFPHIHPTSLLYHLKKEQKTIRHKQS